VAFNPELDEVPREHEPERHGQDEDEGRNGPEDERLLRTRWPEVAEREGGLRDEKRDEDSEQQSSYDIEQPLAHLPSDIIGSGRSR